MFFCWGPPAFFDLSALSNASIQSAGAWVTASGLSATSGEDGVGVLNASRCRAKLLSIAPSQISFPTAPRVHRRSRNKV